MPAHPAGKEAAVADIRTLFFDVGGVLLSNAWGQEQRARAIAHFHLEEEEFRDRHELVVSRFETGRLSLAGYLDRTVFFRPRSFTRGDFTAFLFAQSEAKAESLELARELAGAGRWQMATINNESRELNLYRIRQFGLQAIFRVFFSSCYVKLRKPDEAIYELALAMTQREPQECVFIDDREVNLECARRLGMHALHFRSASLLRQELLKLGVG
jgi:putative hydrolase of the HAD superfamily